MRKMVKKAINDVKGKGKCLQKNVEDVLRSYDELESAFTSDDDLSLEGLPKHAVVLRGG